MHRLLGEEPGDLGGEEDEGEPEGAHDSGGDRDAAQHGGAGHARAAGAEVLARGLDKSAEFEADRIGVVLAARAGYSPYGLVEVLHLLAARSADDSSLALLFKTHPAPDERLTQLGDALAPRVAVLPAGQEPAIRPVDPRTPPPSAAKPAAAEGARALQQQDEGGTKLPGGLFPGGGGGGLRGIFGR